MGAFRHTCPFCGKEFPGWYWVYPRLSLGSKANRGLARGNFNRHKRACEKKDRGGGRGETPTRSNVT